MRVLVHNLVTQLIKFILSVICRVDASALEGLPAEGPYMVIINHVNFLEVPMVYTYFQPRKVYSLVKEETWKNPVLGFLADTWHAIPLRRGVADFAAFSAAEQVFKNGNLLVMAPEGTRTGNGVLRKAHGGAALLAWHHGIPVYPVAHTGGEQFHERFRKLKRTPFTFHVGEPFIVCPPEGASLDAAARRQVTSEMMGRLARLLPSEQRGEYREQAEAPPESLVYCKLLSAESHCRRDAIARPPASQGA